MNIRETVVFWATIIMGTSIETIDSSTSSHVDFHEIFSNSLNMLADDPLTFLTKEDDLHLPPSQYAEFRLMLYTTGPTTQAVSSTIPTTTPPPRFPKPSYLRPDEPTTSEDPSSSTTGTYLGNKRKRTTKTTTTAAKVSTSLMTITTNAPNKDSTEVVPLKNYQRGVLDLILPASRVRNFRDVFKSVRRLLSYTFKK